MRRILPIVVALALLSASGCSTEDRGPLQFGIRRLALDLAFSEDDGRPPPDPEVVVRLVPAPPEALEPGFDFAWPDDPGPLPPLEAPGLACPAAPPEATILLPVSPAIIDPPDAGTYPRRNQGWIEITGANLNLRLPYPLLSAWQISPAVATTRPGAFGLPGSATPVPQFTVTKQLTEAFKVEETYEIGPEALLLIERITTADGIRTRFRTDPPLEVFQYGAEGDSWVSAGVDVEEGFGVVIEARNADREVIDVCGELIETFRIEYDEQVVNLRTGETYGTDQSRQSTINIAPQYGGLIVREELHTLQRTATPEGSPLVVRLDYESTLLSVRP